MKTLCVLTLLSGLVLFAQDSPKPKHNIFKRALAIGACAAQAADFATTAAGANRFHEGNGLMANAQGRPALAKIGLVKAGLCGANIFLATRKNVPTAMVFAFSAPTIAIGSGAAVHNLRKMNENK
jgi:hypothetical protein